MKSLKYENDIMKVNFMEYKKKTPLLLLVVLGLLPIINFSYISDSR